jgi:2-keto-3-deoxy-6-phosphogluconate aldolase
MAAHDMTDAIKHPHHDVPFATIGYDTITELAQLATIFKNKCQKLLAPEISQAPIKVAENKQPAALIQQILTSPMKHNYQTISQHRVSP